jgi:segregation and condensation protein B
MTANNLERVMPLEAVEEKRERRGSLLLPFPSKTMMARPSADRQEKLRILEALLFAAPEPLDQAALAEHFAEGEDIASLLAELQSTYATRGVNLVRVAGKWAFRTAEDLAFLLEREAVEQRRLSRAALETLAIIAYHQPVTRAEIEEIRGVSTSKGTLDVLLETGWIKLRGRRRAPGRPVTYGTTEQFLGHFGFDSIQDLPGLSELKGAGLLDSNLPPGFSMPNPDDAPALREDEDPLEDEPPMDDEDGEPRDGD